MANGKHYLDQMDLHTQIADITSKYGPWTAHNVEIAPGVFTMGSRFQDRANERAQLYLFLIKTFLSKKLKNLNILDLGCLEGGISIELAKHGAICTGVDIRQAHLVKAAFAARSVGVYESCKWIKADVNLSSTWDELGKFDVIICSGLLYHIDGIDLLPLLKNIHQASQKSGIVIVDTNVCSKPDSSLKITEHLTIHGRYWQEHSPEDTYIKRLAAGWSSLHNNKAFWLTERSLVNILVASGFGSVFKPLYPYHEWGHQSRDVWVGISESNHLSKMPFRTDPDPRPLEHPGLK